ncbi:MAG TPA: hypothetical protein DCZ04_14445, partial [Syntrophorhabdus aromaticivorans]|nr:hypothetical protein [Syntrophorhabdus aromaticivorans]
MSILFTQNFDIIQEKEEEYGEFIAQTYVPQMNAMGLASVGGYYVEIGFGPRVVGVHASGSLDELSHILTSKEYKNMALGLKSFVYNYRNAAMEPLGKIKEGGYTIQKNVWKLNQYYDLRPGMKEAYKEFIINEHLPVMSRIDYVEVTGGWNVILGGVSEIIAEFTVKDPIDIGRLMNN